MDKNLIGGIDYTMATNLNLYTVVNDKIKSINSNIMSSLPSSIDGELSSIMLDNFEVIEGEFTNDPNSLFILVDSKNRLSEETLKVLGYEGNISFKDIIGKEFKVVLNDTLYSSYNDTFIQNKIDDI